MPNVLNFDNKDTRTMSVIFVLFFYYSRVFIADLLLTLDILLLVGKVDGFFELSDTIMQNGPKNKSLLTSTNYLLLQSIK